MRQNLLGTFRSLLVWVVMPLRLFLHAFRFTFGFPLISLAVFSVLAAVLFYVGALPGPVGPEGRIVTGGGNPLPGASSLAAVFGMLAGVLILWLAEHGGRENDVWTKAPSLWRPVGQPIG
jgi:hypothetical protein